MKSIVAGVLATITAVGLLSACGDDVKLTVPQDTTPSTGFVIPDDVTLPDDVTIPSDITLPDGVTLPDGATIPAGALPSDVSIPTEVIDQMIAQFEAAGMKVDKECFTALLKDESLRKLVEAGGTPNQEAIQKFFSCIST
jgi:hypothetical protein